ncbi:MAG: hypothetical protein HN703_00290 [Planctomycetaceae bacterium]|nr:hypothetical protein [Planctomycetaceae bacterium]
MTDSRWASSRSPQKPLLAGGGSGNASSGNTSGSLAGKLPWNRPAGTSDSTPSVVVTEACEKFPSKRKTGLFDGNIPLGPFDFFLQFRWREALCNVFQNSPGWSVSLGVHVLLLTVLLVVSVGVVSQKPLRLTLEFLPEPGPPAVVLPGVGPSRVDTKNLQQELAVSEKDVVEDPAAVPAMDRLVPDQESFTARPAEAIGSLLTGRQEGRRRSLLATGGGSDRTELAVRRALAWIVRQQTKAGTYAGLWSLRGPYPNGGSEENRVAATAMALLALQGAGHTTKTGEHQEAVINGWRSILKTQTEAGNFAPASDGHTSSAGRMYGHGQVTIALCELYGLTRDLKIKQAAQNALRYALAAQLPDGGWRYHLPEKDENGFLESWKNRGDLSMTGWFLLALKTAEMAGLESPGITESFERVDDFLDQLRIVSENAEEPDMGYDYQFNPMSPLRKFQPAISAEAILGKLFLGTPPDTPHVITVVDRLLTEAPIAFPESLKQNNRAVDFAKINSRTMNSTVKNIYAWYYITQVCHHVGGSVWRQWNSVMSELLPENQETGGANRGSWSPVHDLYGVKGGRLFTTSLCACMLETYYRHLSLYGGAKRN